MSFAKVYSAQVNLLKGAIVTIEVDLSKGLHTFSVVGLPDKAVDESKDRVSGAIKNSGYKSPKAKNQKITVSLSPADLKKEGPFFDLAIAMAYLKSAGEIKFNSEKKIFLGELGLDGTLRSIRGALPLAEEAKRKGYEEIYLPKENAVEAALVEGIKIFGAESLKNVISHIDETKNPERKQKKIIPQPRTKINYKKETKENQSGDFADIRGQEGAKRGLEIAAGGGAQTSHVWPAGHRQDHAGQSILWVIARLKYRRSAGDNRHSLRGRKYSRGIGLLSAFSCSTSYIFLRIYRWWRNIP